MKLIIDISEELYQMCKSCLGDADCIESAIANGTPLPKGHGRILDEKDILDTENNDGGWYDLIDMPEYIAGVKAIIAADTESEETIHSCDNCLFKINNPDILLPCTDCDLSLNPPSKWC